MLHAYHIALIGNGLIWLTELLAVVPMAMPKLKNTRL